MKFIFAALVFFTVTLVSSAQCHRVTYQYPTTYQYPVHQVVVRENIIVKEVVTPVAVPVLIPAYQFQYVAPCAAPAVAVPQMTPVATPGVQHNNVAMYPMSHGPLSSVGAGNDKDRIRELAKALLAEMNKEVGSGEFDNGPPTAVDFSPGAPQQFGPLAILENRCAKCHTGAESKSGIMIFTAPGYFNPQVDRQRLLDAVEKGRMPLGASTDPRLRLSQQEVAALRAGF